MDQNFMGVIIEESLENAGVLKEVKIVSTEVEQVTPKHKTPWIKKWTMHNVEISGKEAEDIAQKLAQSLDPKHSWYADFKNDSLHFVIFRNKVFKIDRLKKSEYEAASRYGISLGIPAYQLDFSPYVQEWKR